MRNRIINNNNYNPENIIEKRVDFRGNIVHAHSSNTPRWLLEFCGSPPSYNRQNSWICTPDAQLKAAELAEKKGMFGTVQRIIEKNYHPDYTTDAQKALIVRLQNRLKEVETIEAEFGEGALLNLDNPEVQEAVRREKIPEIYIASALRYRIWSRANHSRPG